MCVFISDGVNSEADIGAADAAAAALKAAGVKVITIGIGSQFTAGSSAVANLQVCQGRMYSFLAASLPWADTNCCC